MDPSVYEMTMLLPRSKEKCTWLHACHKTSPSPRFRILPSLASLLAAGPVTLVIGFLLVQLLTAFLNSHSVCFTSGWHSKCTHTEELCSLARARDLKQRRLLLDLFICLFAILSLHRWSRISVAGARERQWEKSIFNNLRDHRALDNQR